MMEELLKFMKEEFNLTTRLSPCLIWNGSLDNMKESDNLISVQFWGSIKYIENFMKYLLDRDMDGCIASYDNDLKIIVYSITVSIIDCCHILGRKVEWNYKKEMLQ